MFGSLTKRKAKNDASAGSGGGENAPSSGGDQLGNALPADQLNAAPAPKTGFSAWLAKTFNPKGKEPAQADPQAAKPKAVSFGADSLIPDSALAKPQSSAVTIPAPPGGNYAPASGNYDMAGSAATKPKPVTLSSPTPAGGGNYDMAGSAGAHHPLVAPPVPPQVVSSTPQVASQSGGQVQADPLRDAAASHYKAGYAQLPDEPEQVAPPATPQVAAPPVANTQAPAGPLRAAPALEADGYHHLPPGGYKAGYQVLADEPEQVAPPATPQVAPTPAQVTPTPPAQVAAPPVAGGGHADPLRAAPVLGADSYHHLPQGGYKAGYQVLADEPEQVAPPATPQVAPTPAQVTPTPPAQVAPPPVAGGGHADPLRATPAPMSGNYNFVGSLGAQAGPIAGPLIRPPAGGQVTPTTAQVTPPPPAQAVPTAAGVASTQARMRAGEGNLSDPAEITPTGRVLPVNREPKTASEQQAGGWATLGVRTGHRGATGHDKAGGIGPQPVQYFKTRAELDQRAQLQAAGDLQRLAALDADIGANVSEAGGTTRESKVVRFAEGKWVDASGGTLDTDDALANSQTVFDKRNAWAKEIGELQKRISLPDAQAKILELEGRVTKSRTHKGLGELGLAGRYIYVMNAAGDFFAAKGMFGILHHSSFMAGGAVACAGEIAISGGRVTLISNASGHYRPGAAYLWQACKQLEALGAPMDSMKVQIMGLSEDFASAAEFLAAMDPSRDPTLFDAGKALDHLRAHQRRRDAAPAPPPRPQVGAGNPAPIVPM